MRFYSLSDTYVLDMPSRRFWALEQQIDRISATDDLRLINVERANGSQEQFDQVIDRLTLEIGETCKVEHNAMVQRSEEAKAALEQLRGKPVKAVETVKR